MGRNGFNVCIFIVLFMVFVYIRFINKNILEFNVGFFLNSSWIILMLLFIVCGNNVYDCVIFGIGSLFFSVVDVKVNLVFVFGNLIFEDIIDFLIIIIDF